MRLPELPDVLLALGVIFFAVGLGQFLRPLGFLFLGAVLVCTAIGIARPASRY